ncbi:TadE/TadG family type IV pilus assembly protein [Planktotalea arctica]|uniref:TadE/TadG family type IV pilus assembly protein n=2 Tax=Planktotalea arctica TaxID=1481893 RepID=UPI000A173A94|nr:TadE/TadG family type IV pilus assembly protein [Planktotalea arctica]
MKQLLNTLRRFRRAERGNVTVEFALVFPVFILILTSSIEMGVITIRQTLLERGLDIAMREVRIGTGSQYSHDDIRDMICDGAVIFEDCEANLRLEMIPNDPRDYQALPATVDCVEQASGTNVVLNPVREFKRGQSNELMIVRACMLYDPVFPTSELALSRTTDHNGKSALVAVSAFTQEPR